MDYTKQPLLFKIRKVLRYVGMYGVRRTRIKILGQLHMKKQYAVLPVTGTAFRPRQTVALIGCGNYSYSNIAYYLSKERGRVIAACMDVDLHRAASLAERYAVPFYTDDARKVLDLPQVRLLYIASNHASHAEYAIEGLRRGKDVYIEKPHVVTEDQLDRLLDAASKSAGKVFLGFNRPGSRFGREILKALGAESGPGMYNWFVAGHAIDPDHWYFKPEEGGRVLGNLCHWTDFVLRMVDGNVFPVRITPTRGAKSDCDIAVTYTFPDETIAVITFSAKGHTFDGVKEKLTAHRGNCLIAMDDYKTLTIEVGANRRKMVNWYRDHGHSRNILNAYDCVAKGLRYDREPALNYAADTAWLFLRTREALEQGATLVAEKYPFPQHPVGGDHHRRQPEFAD